jgi:glycerol uptake facilitator-like aquaporin
MARQPSLPAVTAGALTAEMLGTFMFTLSGTATVLAVHTLRHTTGGFTATGDIAISIAFAFGVVAAVYLVARVSGAHINPAVTVGLAAVGKFPWRMVPGYVVAQLVGGCLAALMNWLMYPSLRGPLILGSTHPGPGVPWWVACVTEVVITAGLMIVVMATAVHERAPRWRQPSRPGHRAVGRGGHLLVPAGLRRFVEPGAHARAGHRRRPIPVRVDLCRRPGRRRRALCRHPGGRAEPGTQGRGRGRRRAALTGTRVQPPLRDKEIAA